MIREATANVSYEIMALWCFEGRVLMTKYIFKKIQKRFLHLYKIGFYVGCFCSWILNCYVVRFGAFMRNLKDYGPFISDYIVNIF